MSQSSFLEIQMQISITNKQSRGNNGEKKTPWHDMGKKPWEESDSEWELILFWVYLKPLLYYRLLQIRMGWAQDSL